MRIKYHRIGDKSQKRIVFNSVRSPENSLEKFGIRDVVIGLVIERVLVGHFQ